MCKERSFFASLASYQECTEQSQAVKRWSSAEVENTAPSPLIVTQTQAEEEEDRNSKNTNEWTGERWENIL